jgi:hypothetical protein
MSSRKSSRRKSLSEKIADFSDPTLRDVHPESLTSWNDNTSANRDDDDDDDDLQEDYHEDDEDNVDTAMSNDGRLRLQAEPDALNDPRDNENFDHKKNYKKSGRTKSKKNHSPSRDPPSYEL